VPSAARPVTAVRPRCHRRRCGSRAPRGTFRSGEPAPIPIRRGPRLRSVPCRRSTETSGRPGVRRRRCSTNTGGSEFSVLWPGPTPVDRGGSGGTGSGRVSAGGRGASGHRGGLGLSNRAWCSRRRAAARTKAIDWRPHFTARERSASAADRSGPRRAGVAEPAGSTGWRGLAGQAGSEVLVAECCGHSWIASSR